MKRSAVFVCIAVAGSVSLDLHLDLGQAGIAPFFANKTGPGVRREPPTTADPYMGLPLPGIVPEKYPGEYDYRFFKNGSECYIIHDGIWYTRLQAGRWMEPINTGIDYGDHSDFELNVSPDGTRLIFNSMDRMLPNGHDDVLMQIWISERNGDTWSTPATPGFGGMFATVSSNQNIYYTTRDAQGGARLARRRYVDGAYADEEIITTADNSLAIEGAHPCISPDESYLIFDSGPGDRINDCGLFITFYEDGQWTPPLNMGNFIPQENAALATLMSEGSLLSYNSRSGDRWWVSSDVITALRAGALRR